MCESIRSAITAVNSAETLGKLPIVLPSDFRLTDCRNWSALSGRRFSTPRTPHGGRRHSSTAVDAPSCYPDPLSRQECGRVCKSKGFKVFGTEYARGMHAHSAHAHNGHNSHRP